MAKKLYEESNIQAIADAIREKNGETTTYKTSEMAAAITNIPSGGGGELPEEAFTVSGSCKFRFAENGWNWFINTYGNKIKTVDVADCTSMFANSTKLTSIPFKINLKSTKTIISMSSMFNGCNILTSIPDIEYTSTDYSDMSYIFAFLYNIEELPYIYNAYPSTLTQCFSNCMNIREFPDDYFDTWNFQRIQTYAYASVSQMFSGCSSLRKLPQKLLQECAKNQATNTYGAMYYGICSNCHSLDEAEVPVSTSTWTSNAMSTAFGNTSRLKKLIFTMNDDGTPQVANWKSQVIDLSTYVGYSNSITNITKHNSGITEDKLVIDDATYQALKNDPDWFTQKLEYCRYNHDSAVETINSLPDTSAYLATAGGTNTIKFKGTSGSATDGGAINTLTEEEIAVAAAKGWTVTFS